MGVDFDHMHTVKKFKVRGCMENWTAPGKLSLARTSTYHNSLPLNGVWDKKSWPTAQYWGRRLRHIRHTIRLHCMVLKNTKRAYQMGPSELSQRIDQIQRIIILSTELYWNTTDVSKSVSARDAGTLLLTYHQICMYHISDPRSSIILTKRTAEYWHS